MQIFVRRATENDIPVILELLYVLGRPIAKNDLEITTFSRQIKQYITNPDKQILVAQTNSKIVGLVSLIFVTRLNQEKLEMYIPELVVAKEYRYKGTGKNLVAECIKIAKEKKCYRIRLESGNQRVESHKFYKKLGFTQHALTFTFEIQ
ncbi:phospholipiddiacylglycerol acyltransferase protein [Marine Group I thaumarchaeote SCGC AAA799-E16]|uniref:Phospholipiddiacylglycerol acyltransferase protein n=4 Tax=Marine Group I TaxID=905826 RepID=A0A087S7L7_9ARCH|nr:phospholipiddiacylglycerol acyltransferase protein [Marine Group I thaumarchaeote SCGC AAA799-N04]KER06071.1 phospholipiddiacylglycerol acyltransferase protein [Marine Group I thaumarchaeote SCGC AAA799-E16]KFM18147.1 phospholipiddiacylglycerol acyltransferase protein [Marine Group I thaumarchaeote SCGC RSA3]KFM21721.1 phospholipiddiacylglycerol acyltransferase protein [Marine Group I thaumarchaeote SCGC AAA799-B03]